MKITLILLGAMLLLLPGLAALKIALEPRALVARGTLGECTMPDGTLLVFEKMTFEGAHNYEFDLPGAGKLSRWLSGNSNRPTKSHVFSSYPSDGAMVVWFTRWDPNTLAPLDFDWWLSTVLVDHNGEEIEDTNPHRYTTDGSSSSSMGADRPWSPHVGSPTPAVIVAASELPMLRLSVKTRRLRVYNREGTVVAEFDLPSFPARIISGWAPEPLPAVKHTGDLAVTFTGISVKARPAAKTSVLDVSRRRPHWSVTPEFTVTRNGVSTSVWKAEPMRLSDALGNSAWAGDCRLSIKEPAWKLQVTLVRAEPAAFAPEERFTSEPLSIPEPDASGPLDIEAVVEGVELKVLAIGRGLAEYSYAVPTSHHTTHHGSRKLGGKTYNVSHNVSSRASGSTVTSTAADSIASDLVHIVLDLANLPANHRDVVAVEDDQGRRLPHALDRVTSGNVARCYVFVDPPADVKSLRVTVCVQTAKTFEVLIAPPRDNPDGEVK